MIWLKRILMIIGALVLLTYFLPSQREQLITCTKHLLELDTPTFVQSKITVYQSQGKKGEAVFSDQQNMTHTAQTRVVDNANGMTMHMAVPKKEEKSSSVLNFSENNAQFQQQAQAVQQARMERAIGE